MSAQREAVREVEAQAAEVRRLTATLRLQTLRAEVKAAQALRLLAEERKRTRPATANDNKNKVDGGDADTHSGSRHDPADTPTEAAGEQRTPTKDEASNDDPEPPCFHQHAAWGTELVNASTPVAKYTVTDNGEGIHYHTLYAIPPEQEADALEKLRRIAPENRLNTKNTPRGLCVKILPHGKETGNEYEGEGSNHTATTRAAEATPPQSTTAPGESAQTPPTATTDTRSLLLRLRWWGITTWIKLHTGAEREQGEGGGRGHPNSNSPAAATTSNHPSQGTGLPPRS